MSDPLVNVDAEEALLGSLFHPDLEPADVAVLDDRDFSGAPRATLFRVLKAMHARGAAVDLTTVGAELQRLGLLDQVGGALELSKLPERVPSGAGVSTYVPIVRQLAQRRRIVDEGQRLTHAAADLTTPLESIQLDLREQAAAPAAEVGFTYLDLNAIAENGIPPIDWLIEGWLVRGDIALVAGAAYSGKTTTIADLLIALASGRPWCGIRPATVGPVLAFDEEQGEALTARLFLRLGAQRVANLRVASGQGVNVATSDGFARLEREIASVLPLVVLLDSATQVFCGIDENDAGQVAPVFARLFKLRDKYGVAFLIVHHLKKPPAEGKVDLLTSLRGSTAWGTQASTVWVAKRINDVTIDLIQAKRRGASPTSLRIGYAEDCAGGAITLSGGPRLGADDTKDAELRRHILDLLASAGAAGMARNDILAGVRGSDSNALRVLEELRGAGEITRNGKGTRWEPFRFLLAVPVPPIQEAAHGERQDDASAVPVSQNGSERQNGTHPDLEAAPALGAGCAAQDEAPPKRDRRKRAAGASS